MKRGRADASGTKRGRVDESEANKRARAPLLSGGYMYPSRDDRDDRPMRDQLLPRALPGASVSSHTVWRLIDPTAAFRRCLRWLVPFADRLLAMNRALAGVTTGCQCAGSLTTRAATNAEMTDRLAVSAQPVSPQSTTCCPQFTPHLPSLVIWVSHSERLLVITGDDRREDRPARGFDYRGPPLRKSTRIWST